MNQINGKKAPVNSAFLHCKNILFVLKCYIV